ncbi:MAG: methyl-accepting chemotaxis protein [Pseudomonadota bacterium]
MAKKAANSTTFNISAVLVPLFLAAAAAVIWFTYTPPQSAVTGPSPALAAAVRDSITTKSGAVETLQRVAANEPATGASATAVRSLLGTADQLQAFNGAVSRAGGASAAILDKTTGLDESALADLRQGATFAATQLRALRGAPERAAETAAELVTVANELAVLAAALNGDATALDVAALNDGALSAELLDDTFVLRSAAEVVQGEAETFARAAAIVSTFPTPTAVPAATASGLAATLAPVMPWLPIALLALALLPVLAMVRSSVKDAEIRRVALEQADQNERNQQAILRLFDELGSLADGDLTVEATVTEDITGVIADSINYAIEALRELVTTIDGTAAMVDAATRQTETTAVHMNRSAQKQTLEIAATAESISAIAASIEEVSGNAERSSDVARHSVDVAHKGGDAVRRTIEGMNTIRETIQETSKRIKRLGESSQEIGNIVELINDIAEQTNILALNASIQASMAGEAGRGFAVVADEVQRLAERSTNATKQIEVLVRTIQADTNEAVVSMERSTTDVVGGALLAENAGAALDEIEQVSNQIASLVQNIYSSARNQSKAASDISRRTVALREISSQTGKATSATTSSIGKLAQLAGELRKSVSGFRLPESASVTRITRSQESAAEDAAREAS